jgi:hypothetical protein
MKLHSYYALPQNKFLLAGYFKTVSVTQPVKSRMVRWNINNELERIRKERSLPNSGIIPAFAWRDWRKLWKTSAMIIGVPAEIRTEYLPNTRLENYRYTYMLSPQTQNNGMSTSWESIWANINRKIWKYCDKKNKNVHIREYKHNYTKESLTFSFPFYPSLAFPKNTPCYVAFCICGLWLNQYILIRLKGRRRHDTNYITSALWRVSVPDIPTLR